MIRQSPPTPDFQSGGPGIYPRRKCNVIIVGFTAAAKLFRLKGTGFQPVRNYFEMNVALQAAEKGRIGSESRSLSG